MRHQLRSVSMYQLTHPCERLWLRSLELSNMQEARASYLHALAPTSFYMALARTCYLHAACYLDATCYLHGTCEHHLPPTCHLQEPPIYMPSPARVRARPPSSPPPLFPSLPPSLNPLPLFLPLSRSSALSLSRSSCVHPVPQD